MPSNPQLFNFLYSGEINADLGNLLFFIEGFYKSYGAPTVSISYEALNKVFAQMVQDFPHPTGTEKSSPFKKVAAFTTNFVAERPVITPLPVNPFDNLSTHQNAIIAFELSRAALHGATINCKVRGPLTIEKPIKVSCHYWKDTIACLSKCSPTTAFEPVSLIYEALAYNDNPTLSYPRDF